jgi:endonuclease/exonuclease/phosphatase family metal-dependent hydrolase
MPQADFLAPEGYEAVYRTNAITRHGEHGNALLSRWPVAGHQHEDISDHRFEQRGLLHVHVRTRARRACDRGAPGPDSGQPGAPGGLLERFIEREVRAMRRCWWRATSTTGGSKSAACSRGWACSNMRSRVPSPTQRACLLAQLDHVYARGLTPVGLHVPRGRVWWRMSDHLP